MQELEKIAELIGGLGDDGVRAFVWYLVANLVETLGKGAIVLFALWLIPRGIISVVGKCNSMERLADAYKTPGNHSMNWNKAIDAAIKLKEQRDAD